MIKTYEINEDLAGLVPMANEAEQAVLTMEIQQEDGLLLPIVLWRGEIVDGRCRQKACIALNIEMTTTDLDSTLTFEEVAKKVKGLNSRRNLTPTQKVMAACKQSLRKSNKVSIMGLAKSWGISRDILSNARYIYHLYPHYIDILFDGGSITITDNNGDEKITNKVTTIYSYLKKLEEQVKEDTTYAWQEDTYITTQAGKEWYYNQIRELESTPNQVRLKMIVAELANYKFNKEDTQC